MSVPPSAPASAGPGDARTPVTTAQVLQLMAALATLAGSIAWVLPVIRLRFPTQTHTVMLDPLGENGELVRQQSGHDAQLLLIESTPDGAEVEVDGIAQGRTPLSTELHCPSGDKAAVVVHAAGFHSFQTKVPCATGTLVRLNPKLSHR